MPNTENHRATWERRHPCRRDLGSWILDPLQTLVVTGSAGILAGEARVTKIARTIGPFIAQRRGQPTQQQPYQKGGQPLMPPRRIRHDDAVGPALGVLALGSWSRRT